MSDGMGIWASSLILQSRVDPYGGIVSQKMTQICYLDCSDRAVVFFHAELPKEAIISISSYRVRLINY